MSGRCDVRRPPSGTSSLLTLDSMSTMIFERQLVAYELQEVSGAGIKMWWNRRWEIIFAATRPLNEFSTHHRVSIILNFPPGSPVDATIKDRLVALAKAVDAITSA